MAITKLKRERMEKLIYDFFDAFDKTGRNTKRYRELFEPMTDAQFDNWFKAFFADDKAYLILDIIDYENSIKYEDIERAAKVINVPLFEYVYLPHISSDMSRVVRTKTPVPVGYINIKRTQQTVSKKNGISTGIDQRSAITSQVTGADKNGRNSDLEGTMLVSLGMTNALKELNGPRADDLVMKNQMQQQIALTGQVDISMLDDLPENKTTLNTVNVYLLGMGLNSDLVTSGLMTKQSIKENL